MKSTKFLNEVWSCVAFDSQYKVVEVVNIDDKLFFGKQILVGMTLDDFADGDNGNVLQIKIIADSLERARQEKRNVYLEYLSRSKGGETTRITAHAICQADGSVSLYAAGIHESDIDRVCEERVEAKQQDEMLYNQMMTALNHLPVGVAIYAHSGSIIYFNDKFCSILEVDKDEILQNPIKINDNPRLPDEVKNAIRNRDQLQIRFACDSDAVTDIEEYNTTHSGVRYLECGGTPILNSLGEISSYIVIIDDVTDQVVTEEALQQSTRKTEVAMQAADIMIWEFDVHSRMFISDNEPLNGYDCTKRLSISDYIDSLHPDDRAIPLQITERMCEGEDYVFHFDTRVRFPDSDDWQYCRINGLPYGKDRNGKVTKYVGARKNNTELQKRKILQDKILNSIPLPIHIKDVEENFRYVFCNDESKRMFGTSEDKTTYDLMSSSEVARIEKTDKEVFSTGKPYLGCERITLKDGRSYDTIVRKSIFEDDGKQLLLNVRWDQSLQNNLQRRAKVLSISMEAMNAYTWFYEPAKDMINFGEGFDKLGKDATDVNSLSKFVQSIHPDDREMFTQTIDSVMELNSGTWKIEYRIDLDGYGKYQWWETRGVLETSTLNDAPYKYMLGMSINIEMHKQTELTLLNNREELKHLVRQNELVLNNTNSGLAYITNDYVVQWENVSQCSASISYEAYKQGEVCYKSAHNRTTPCDNCVMRRAQESHQVEHILFCINNNRIVEIFATPVINDNNDLEGIVIRVDDVTEREQMIEELRYAKAQAEQSDKLKSAFLANMSHEIRTPLNAIVGFSDLMMCTEEKQEKQEYMKIINNNNELLLKLINDILDLSKIEAGSIELKYDDFDLAQYFDEMASSMGQRVSNPQVRLIASNPYPECRVKLDRNRVAQIMTNYVTNAIKYTPKGFIEMGYDTVPNGIRLWVKDSGIGIAKDKLDKVFHRFAKLDEFAQGTGLGLSICKAIVESMGGSVGFESTLGEGSLFWAVLPCDVEVHADASVLSDELTGDQTEKSVRSESCEERERKTILVAEDIQSNYMLLSAMLRKNYDLLHAENGQEAVEMVKINSVDLLLMDMKMPIMNGLTATAEIRKFNSELPILALTAHAFDSDREAALAAGCNDYLVKPIDKARLMEALAKFGCTEKF